MARKNFLQRTAGDKVVWIIALMLCFISVVCIFSASSKQVRADNTRLDIVRDQLITVAGGLLTMFIVYQFKIRRFFRISRLGFFASLSFLLMLQFKVDFGFVHVLKTNEACRILIVGGVQVHVYELAKVLMICYMAWAVESIKNDDFPKFNAFVKRHPSLASLKERSWKEVIFICAPILITCGLVMLGSNSSAFIIGGVLVMMLIIGEAPWRDVAWVCGIAVGAFALMVALSLALPEDKAPRDLGRIQTFISRTIKPVDYKAQFLAAKEKSAEWYDARSKFIQIEGAKMAVKEGGILGKGPGQSSQKYLVPIMSEDYMFSFIIEEYGLWGAALIMALYLGLLARGSIIARNCTDGYGKLIVSGCCLLIAGQAFLHMAVNSNFGLTTGQTLPMISNGTSAFLCFSFAFGLILSTSKTSRKLMDKENKKVNIYDTTTWDTDQSEQ